MKVFSRFFLLACGLCGALGVAHASNDDMPQVFAQLPSAQVQHVPQANVLALPHSSMQRFHLDITALTTVANQQNRLAKSAHNIDSQHTSFSQSMTVDGRSYTLLHTQGQTTSIGELVGHGQHWFYVSTDAGTWSTDLTEIDAGERQHINDTIGTPEINTRALAKNATDRQARLINGYHVTDVLLLYTPNIVAEFPGELTQTLLEHLIFKANQTFVNSNINVQLRLVGTEFVAYTQPSSLVALDELLAALREENVVTSSLQSIADVRDAVGADMVAMIRTHDLNEREVCGVAIFPNSQDDFVANISNVGISGGSNCAFTFTHEVGHNFAAEHQKFGEQITSPSTAAGALIVPGQFNTIMSSIGTGDVNRNYKLEVFSNPSATCGGLACGDSRIADNAAAITAVATQNANHREPVLPLTNLVVPLRTFPDQDGDGVDQTLDAFPFIATETSDTDIDGVGDNSDAFPNDATETRDFDGDGIGDNADADADNDGVPDTSDALPFDAASSVDSDLDGVGDNLDAFPFDFQETQNFDNDAFGALSDTDNDDDGVDDYTVPNVLSASSMVVVSADSQQLLEYDATTGNFLGQIASFEPLALTFRSDIVRDGNNLYFVEYSDVVRYNLVTGEKQIVVDRSALLTNFPVHIVYDDNRDRLIVNNGLGRSFIETFDLSNNGNNLINQIGTVDVYRDMVLLDNNRLVVVNRSSNRLVTRTFNESSVMGDGSVFANQGLDKPEHIVRLNDGRLLVSNAGTGNIVAFDAAGGFLGEFVAAGDNGLATPTCMERGPDNRLYVCSGATDEIFVYDTLTSGLFTKIVTAGAGGLDRPVGIVFIGKVLDDEPFNPQNDSDFDGVSNILDPLPLDGTETSDVDGDGIGDNADTDNDNDGMPDSFELTYDFDPLDPSDANGDADGDGISNVNEYNQRSNPRRSETDFEAERASSGGAMHWWLWLGLGYLVYRRRTMTNRIVTSKQGSN